MESCLYFCLLTHPKLLPGSRVQISPLQWMHYQIFRLTTFAMLMFRTKWCTSSTALLCGLSTSPHMKNNNYKMHTDDLCVFDSLDKCVKKVQLQITNAWLFCSQWYSYLGHDRNTSKSWETFIWSVLKRLAQADHPTTQYLLF